MMLDLHEERRVDDSVRLGTWTFSRIASGHFVDWSLQMDGSLDTSSPTVGLMGRCISFSPPQRHL
jgi:hypothetical protein